ncbi:g887 [Coccomyxa elongata]
MSSDIGIISRLAITRASLPQALTYTGSSNTSLPGNLAITGSLAVAGSLSVAGVSTSTLTSTLTGTLTAIAASIGSVSKLAIDTSGNATTPGTVTAVQLTGSNASIAGTLTLGSRIAAKLPQVQVQQVFGPFNGGTNTSFVFLGGTQLWQVSANIYCTTSASGKTTFTLLIDGATPTASGSNVVYFYGNNTCSSDLSYPVMMFTTTLAAGTHTVQMNSTGSGYTSDSNKMANLAVTEYPT